MNRPMHKFAVRFIVGCSAILPLAAGAQQFGAADSFYTSGVEAYFRGCSAEAESSFSSLMGIDPTDARAFYFRALSLMAQGRCDEARTDMQVGAQLEARSPNRFDIGKTLERVQGPTRLLLERYRSQARNAAGLNPPRGAVKAPDAPVLRERRVVPLDEFARPGEPQSIVAPEPAPEPVTPPAPAKTQPAEKVNSAPAGPADPFQEDSAASPAPEPQSKTPPAKAPAPKTPPPKAPLPPAPKETTPAPKPSVKVENDDNPF